VWSKEEQHRWAQQDMRVKHGMAWQSSKSFSNPWMSRQDFNDWWTGGDLPRVAAVDARSPIMSPVVLPPRLSTPMNDSCILGMYGTPLWKNHQ